MKRLVSLILILAMAILPVMTAYSAMPGGVRMNGATQSINYHYDPYLEDIDLRYDTTFDFPLTTEMFEWDIIGTLPGEAISRSSISHNRVSVRTSRQSGAFSSIFETPTIVYKSSRASGGQPTATIEIKVRKGVIISSRKTFSATLFLSINGSRDSVTEYEFSGSVMPGGGSDVYDGDYIDISDGTVLQPSQRARNVELFLGGGVTMKTNLSAHKRYSGIAYSNVSSADERLMQQYPSISDVLVVKQTGLEMSGYYVSIDAGYDYYVYNADKRYIGRTTSTLPFSSKYYLAEKQINMGSIDNPAPTPDVSDDDHISREGALSQTRLALSTAKKATVQYKNADCILISTLQEMNTVAKNAGGSVSLVVDTTTSKGSVQGRITVPAASAAKLNKNSEIKLRVFTDNQHVSTQKTKFEKWYSNKMAVISTAHQGSFGMKVHIDAKVNLGSMKTSSLHLYRYDKSANTIKSIKDSDVSVDKNGYIHFNTSVGGDIIITDSALKKR